MELGFVLPNNWGIDDVGAIVDLAVEAEELGLDSVWVNHHVINVGYIADRLGDAPYHDALTVLTAAAARTARIKLGTSVLVMPYLHPMVLAKALATIDRLSHGRVIAGLGVGSLPEENEILGVDYDNRGPWSDEFIEVLTALWGDGPADFTGDHFSMSAVVTSPKPAQDPLPIWIGGSGRPAQRRAARVGQGWHPMCSADGLARRMPGFTELLEANGRARSDVTVAPRVGVEAVETIDQWTEAGADGLIIGAAGSDLSAHRDALHRIAALR